MNLADRLRAVVRPRSGGPEGPPLRSPDSDSAADPGGSRDVHAVADVLEGEWHERDGHRYLVIDRVYRPGYRLGRVAVADCLPSAEGWNHLDVLAGIRCGPNLLFLDLETTGLAGGAGTYAFLVGCGWFSEGTFRVRQFFLASHAGERALLDAVSAAAATAGALVTYNGKTFDVPLLDTRFLFHRRRSPFPGLAHIDMLHPARRLWAPPRRGAGGRGEGEAAGSARLTAMEQALLGHAREGDVPGFEIPARYFHFVRTGDARPLQAVLEHNRLDLLSLAMMTARAARLLEEGPGAAETAREALGLGRLFERAGHARAACASYERAACTDTDPITRADALQAWARLCRRERRHADAARIWKELLALAECPPALAAEAAEALAIHHEHRARDLQAARQFAVRSLQLGRDAEALRYRLSRLDRKLDLLGGWASP